MSKRALKSKRRSKALPVLGFAGLSLSLASGASRINQRSDDEYTVDLTAS